MQIELYWHNSRVEPSGNDECSWCEISALCCATNMFVNHSFSFSFIKVQPSPTTTTTTETAMFHSFLCVASLQFLMHAGKCIWWMMIVSQQQQQQKSPVAKETNVSYHFVCNNNNNNDSDKVRGIITILMANITTITKMLHWNNMTSLVHTFGRSSLQHQVHHKLTLPNLTFVRTIAIDDDDDDDDQRAAMILHKPRPQASKPSQATSHKLLLYLYLYGRCYSQLSSPGACSWAPQLLLWMKPQQMVVSSRHRGRIASHRNGNFLCWFPVSSLCILANQCKIRPEAKQFIHSSLLFMNEFLVDALESCFIAQLFSLSTTTTTTTTNNKHMQLLWEFLPVSKFIWFSWTWHRS